MVQSSSNLIIKKIYTLIRIIRRFWRHHQIASDIRRRGGYITKSSDLNIEGEFCFGESLIISSYGVDVVENSHITVCKNATLSFGDYSGISSSSIYCAEKVEIGNYVNIGAGCFIMDTNFHSTNWRHRIDRNLDIANARTAPVKIDDFVFVGARSIICKGVHIGEHSIISAGSVVVKDVPPNQVWGGNPAAFIKYVE